MMSRVIILLSFALISAFSPGCATTQRSADGETETKRTPREMSDLYTDLATSALVNDDLPRAIENLRIALQYNNDNAIAHNHLGLAYLGLGKRAEAKAEYERAVAIDPKYSDAFVNIGTWHFSNRDYTLARHYYNKALENLEYKSRFLPLTSIGHIELTQGNRDEAKKQFFEALADNPEYCLAHMLLGRVYEMENRQEKAVGEYKASIKGTCVKNIEGQYQLGVVYERLKQYSKARAQFTQVMETFPNTQMAEMAGEKLKEIP